MYTNHGWTWKWTWHHSKLAVEEVSFFSGLRVVLLQLLSMYTLEQWALRTWVWLVRGALTRHRRFGAFGPRNSARYFGLGCGASRVSILPDDLDLQPASQQTRSSYRKKRQHLRAPTEAYRNSFATHTIPIWNTLPAHVVEADSIEAFKSQLAAQALP